MPKFAYRRLHLELGTNVCNYDCAFCFQGKHSKDIKDIQYNSKLPEILNFVKKHPTAEIFVQGGEITINPKMYAFCENITEQTDSFLAAFTNGSFFDKKWAELFARRGSEINFSVHACDPIKYHSFCGGDLSRVVANIKRTVALCREFERFREKKCNVRLSLSLCTLNIDSLSQYYDFAVGLGVDELRLFVDRSSVYKLIPSPQARTVFGLFLKKLDAQAIVPTHVLKDIAMYLGYTGLIPITKTPPQNQADLAFAQQSSIAQSPGVICTCPWDSLFIDGAGKIRTCCTTTNVLGLMSEKTLEEIIESQQMKSFQQRLLVSDVSQCDCPLSRQWINDYVLGARRARVLIVTNEVVGPTKNGGIGTHAYHLARLLANHKIPVSIFYTGVMSSTQRTVWHERYKKMGIVLEFLDTGWRKQPHDAANLSLSKSHAVYRAIKDIKADIIHFQDWLAEGFVSFRAKKLGMDFIDTKLILTAHGSSQWAREANRLWTIMDIDNELAISFMEEYCYEQADLVVFPSKYMAAYCEQYKIKAATQVKYPLIGMDLAKRLNKGKQIAYDHLVFFGRLEERKGLRLFCDAVRKIFASTEQHGIKQITFLGKHTKSEDLDSNEYLRVFLKDLKREQVTGEVISDLNAFEAISYLEQTKAIAVLPSLVDNLPFAILECIVRGIPFISTKVGGIPEIANHCCLAEPTPDSLQKIIAVRQSLFAQDIHHDYMSAQAEQGWLSLHGLVKGKGLEGLPAKKVEKKIPLVSVVISHYEHGEYLPLMLASLKKQTYKQLEVIIVDACSKTSAAVLSLQRLQHRYSDFKFFFLDSRRSLGYARNYGVKQAKGKYVVFCDADNIAKPDMLEKFVSVAERLDADCLTCGNDVFEKSVKNILHCYFPLGPCFTLGISKNVFGDANFLVKRSVFEKLQGFTDSAVNVGCEDWEFLYKLAWRGFSYEVIPENLYFYRATAGQMSQTTDGLKNMYRINLLGKNLGMGNLFLYMASLQKRIDALQALVTRQSVQSIRDKALIKKLGGKLLIQEIRFQGHGGVKLANAIKKIFSVLRIFESGKKNE